MVADSRAIESWLHQIADSGMAVDSPLTRAALAAETASVAIVLLTLSQRPLYANRAFRELFPVDMEAMDFDHLCGQSLTAGWFESVASSGTPQHRVWSAPENHSGETRRLLCSLVRVNGEGQTPAWLTLTLVDTARVESSAPHQLDEEERGRLQALSGTGEWTVAVADRGNIGRSVMHWSPGMSELHGIAHSSTHTVGQWIEQVHANDRQALRAALRQTLSGDSQQFTVRFRLAADPARVIACHALTGRRVHEGHAMRVVGIERDISDAYVGVTQTLKKSVLVRALLESSDDAVFVVDDHGFLLCFNEAFRGLLSPQQGAVPEVGASIAKIFGEEQRRVLMRNIRLALGGEHRAESWLPDPGPGEGREFDLTYSPLKSDHGRTIGVTIIGRDVTQRAPRRLI